MQIYLGPDIKGVGEFLYKQLNVYLMHPCPSIVLLCSLASLSCPPTIYISLCTITMVNLLLLCTVTLPPASVESNHRKAVTLI